MSNRVVVVGAGVGGLSAAALLAHQGADVTVLERAEHVGGKLRIEHVGDRSVDAGPTVLTMRWALERVFDEAGASLTDHLLLSPLETVARHSWQDGAELDLFADVDRSAAAIEVMSGRKEADGYVAFAEYARRIWDLVRGPFIESQRPNPSGMLALAAKIGARSFVALDSTRSMSAALQTFFRDPRLVQLFGRYATYCGSSPFTAPATLNCVAHVEREGVWSVAGGMQQIALGLATVASRRGACIRTGAHVAEILVRGGAVSGVRLASGELLAADQVIFNGDVAALSQGLLGKPVSRASTTSGRPSFSAVTLAVVGRATGRGLSRHNVFFSRDCSQEFSELDQGRLPSDATLYVCAQDRDSAMPPSSLPERFFVIVNAPPTSTGGSAPSQMERDVCEQRILHSLSQFGLTISVETPSVLTTPADFGARFPGTRGAIYGAATTGMWSSFSRAGSKTSIRGLYLAGGSAHPGSGVPMAALSGRLAARSISEDLRSTERWRPTAMLGGTSTG